MWQPVSWSLAHSYGTSMTCPSKKTSRMDPLSKSKPPKARRWEAMVASHGISLVAGEGTDWTKFAETWVKFAGGAEAGEMVNDEMETLAQTSWRYCCNGVAQKDKRFNYGRFLHQEQKNVECFQGWRSKDTHKLGKGLVINGKRNMSSQHETSKGAIPEWMKPTGA